MTQAAPISCGHLRPAPAIEIEQRRLLRHPRKSTRLRSSKMTQRPLEGEDDNALLRRARELARVCTPKVTQPPAVGGDENALPISALAAAALRPGWVSFGARRWVSFAARRGALPANGLAAVPPRPEWVTLQKPHGKLLILHSANTGTVADGGWFPVLMTRPARRGLYANGSGSILESAGGLGRIQGRLGKQTRWDGKVIESEFDEMGRFGAAKGVVRQFEKARRGMRRVYTR